MVARAHGRRHSAAERGAAASRARSGWPYWFYLTCVVHADTHCAYGTQSGLPLSQVASGVFHRLIESR